ncbi:unnamed protein product [Adineta ricciae]|uniref:EF-hand domain-containing protein n=1 Tax=Adineta ricciae TaxID=249248 RepID=A0A813RKQ4_ADIRI|nr:unnamed protein product [Adineta ricciae]
MDIEYTVIESVHRNRAGQVVKIDYSFDETFVIESSDSSTSSTGITRQNREKRNRSYDVEITREQYQTIARKQSNALEFDAFVDVLRPFIMGFYENGELETAFRRLDSDRSGTIHLDELNNFLPILNDSVNNQALQDYVRKVDENFDGTMNYDEFHNLADPLGQLPTMEPNLNSNNKRAAPDGNDDADNNNNNNNNNKRSRTNRVDLRFLLASRDAGAIIGRQGKNIQMLRSKYKTIVQVPDQDGPERILTIAGELEPCLDCLTDALATMAENQKLRQDISELRVLVHTSQAGAVIGKGGERVKELRTRHGLELKVFSDTCPDSTDRVILCRGEQRAILNCLRDIFTQIDKIPPRGPIHPCKQQQIIYFPLYYVNKYLDDPSCYSEQQIHGYGGFAHDETSMYGDRRGRGGGSNGNGGSDGGGFRGYDQWEMNNMRGGGMYNDDYGRPPNHSFYPPSAPAPPPPPPPPLPHHQMMMGGGGNSGHGPIRPMMSSYDQSPDTETQQVTIPHELAGAIIGPRGTRISQIRQQSGASIKIDDPLPGTNDRIITIVGARNQISQAQHLLQTAVRQSGLYPG